VSLTKRCSASVPPTDSSGVPNPFYCRTSPRCDHPWHYYFRSNGHRYRSSTETSDKHRARDIEARERARILEGRHGIRRQPDITVREFSRIYLRDHAEMHLRDKGQRVKEILNRLNEAFGSLILHQLTAHRIEQWKRERLASRVSSHQQERKPRAIKPATVNRELDALRAMLSKAVEWGQLLESPARRVKRLRVENCRTRILSEDEESRLVAACRGQFRALITLALLTGARRGELLALEWAHVSESEIVFLETKSGQSRRLPISPAMLRILDSLPKHWPWVFTNPVTEQPYTTVAKSLERALERAGISTQDVSFHTLRHTALSRMIAGGHSDHTVMAISGHSTTRMLQRYTHPTQTLKLSALETGAHLSTNWPQTDEAGDRERKELRDFLRPPGGRREARTRDLRDANAALSQLS
jgi:integrase